MANTDLALIAHLMRRAGFGATRDELEALASQHYEAIVEDLLHPERFPEVDDDVVIRYWLELNNPDSVEPWNTRWIYRMVQHPAPAGREDGSLLAPCLRDLRRQERARPRPPRRR